MAKKTGKGRVVGRTMFGTPAWQGNAFASALGVARGTGKVFVSGAKAFEHTPKSYAKMREEGWQRGAFTTANVIVEKERAKKWIAAHKPVMPKKSIYANEPKQPKIKKGNIYGKQ